LTADPSLEEVDRVGGHAGEKRVLAFALCDGLHDECEMRVYLDNLFQGCGCGWRVEDAVLDKVVGWVVLEDGDVVDGVRGGLW
jgi:hypothetical protein